MRRRRLRQRAIHQVLHLVVSHGYPGAGESIGLNNIGTCLKILAVDGSDGTLYMYGPDADRLFAAIKPALEACAFMKGAVAKLRYGPPAADTREREVRFAS